MGRKDISQKTLESYSDVFADILNVLLWNGEQRVQEGELVEANTVSTYHTGSELKWQGRDVCKYWQKNRVRIALCGFENQSEPDPDMPLRVISYDGSAYRTQLSGKERYPVITLVLYFGMKHWKSNMTLHERLNLNGEFKRFVNDYRLNIVEVAFLSEEQIAMFRSDFKYLADYMVQKRKNKGYVPLKGTIRHIEAVLEALSAFSNDDTFLELLEDNEFIEGEHNMCNIVDQIKKEGKLEGRREGLASGRKEGAAQTKLQCIRTLMKNASVSVDQAMTLLGIRGRERTVFRKAIQGALQD